MDKCFRRSMLFGSILLCAVGTSQAQNFESEHPYLLKEEYASGLTNIRGKAARSNIPLDRTYDRLTPAQVAFLKSVYVAMPPSDEPPFPATGMESLVRSVAFAAGALRVRGELLAVATIGPDGKASAVRVMKSPNREIGDIVAKLLMVERFKPARCSQQACTMEFVFAADFE